MEWSIVELFLSQVCEMYCVQYGVLKCPTSWHIHPIPVWNPDYQGETAIGSTTTSGNMDYLNGRHPFPWHISFCGDFDIVGNQKPQSLYRTVLWGVRQMEMLVHRPSKFAEKVRHVIQSESCVGLCVGVCVRRHVCVC